LKVVKVNVDEEPGLAVRFGISSIPTVVLLERGIPVAGTVGSRGRPEQTKRDETRDVRDAAVVS